VAKPPKPTMEAQIIRIGEEVPVERVL
jgi:hypothetical protein